MKTPKRKSNKKKLRRQKKFRFGAEGMNDIDFLTNSMASLTTDNNDMDDLVAAMSGASTHCSESEMCLLLKNIETVEKFIYKINNENINNDTLMEFSGIMFKILKHYYDTLELNPEFYERNGGTENQVSFVKLILNSLENYANYVDSGDIIKSIYESMVILKMLNIGAENGFDIPIAELRYYI